MANPFWKISEKIFLCLGVWKASDEHLLRLHGRPVQGLLGISSFVTGVGKRLFETFNTLSWRYMMICQKYVSTGGWWWSGGYNRLWVPETSLRSSEKKESFYWRWISTGNMCWWDPSCRVHLCQAQHRRSIASWVPSTWNEEWRLVACNIDPCWSRMVIVSSYLFIVSIFLWYGERGAMLTFQALEPQPMSIQTCRPVWAAVLGQ